MPDLPPKPEYGEFQTAEWSDDYGFWVIRDLTPEELAIKFPPPEPDPNAVPQSITMRQLLIGLMGAEWITPAEADAWSADGTLPPTITAVIDALPTEAERVAARITARKMSSAYRNDLLLIAAAQAAMPDATEQEISDALDDAFRAWSQI